MLFVYLQYCRYLLICEAYYVNINCMRNVNLLVRKINNYKQTNMEKKYNYVSRLDVKFGHQQLIDIPQMIKECKDKWFNQTLTKVNDSVVRLAIIKGEYHWHKHNNDDEFFFVLDGKVLIDTEEQTFELNKNQGVTISKGVMHRPRAPKKAIMLMVETSTIQPTGD